MEAAMHLYSSPMTNRQIAKCSIWSEIITHVYFQNKKAALFLCGGMASKEKGDGFKRESHLWNISVHGGVCK